MRYDLMHPADQLVLMMNRIYYRGMTTTSGGNLSIKDENGDLWITPSGIDKGMLTRDDINRVMPDGTITGRHRPSSEYPFHMSVYQRRPDIKAVLHAHSPALVAFSIARAACRTSTSSPPRAGSAAILRWLRMRFRAVSFWDRRSRRSLRRAIPW